jgi:hypothetical protein
LALSALHSFGLLPRRQKPARFLWKNKRVQVGILQQRIRAHDLATFHM